MANEDIRREIERYRLKHYEIAAEIGISDFTFSRWLHRDLDENRRKMIMDAIRHIVENER